MMLFDASVVHWLVAGFHSSAALAARAGSMLTNPCPRVPPVMSTWPSGRMVEVRWRRGTDIEPALCHVGLPDVRSIFSAVAVGSPALGSGVFQPRDPPPPAIRILPGSYIAPVP